MKKHLLLFALLLLISGAMFGQTVATPTFYPEGGTFTEPQCVTINCTTEGATIHYTTDGSEPIISSPEYTQPLNIVQTTTVKAKAWVELQPSETASATYTINNPEPELIVNPSSLSDFNYVFGDGPSDTKTFSISGTDLTDIVRVIASENYEVCLTSDGSYAGNLEIILVSGTVDTLVYVRLAEGLAVDEYLGNITVTCDTLQKNVELSGMVNPQPVVSTPTFSPEGGNYTEVQTVTINCSTEGATIRYTLDNTDPTVNSDTFTEGLTITEPTTIMAKAWKEGYQVSETASATYTFTYDITVHANPSYGGTVAGGGTFSHGTLCTVHASADPGYTFINWTENGIVVSEENSYEFVVIKARTLVANFSISTYTIEASPDPIVGGTVTGGGTYDYGIQAYLTATPNDGYTFVKWTKNESTVSWEPSYTVPFFENAAYVAHFMQVQYSINTETSEIGTIMVDQNEAAEGTTITISIVDVNECFDLDTIIVYNTNHPLQTVPISNYKFTMPNHPVTVKAEFKHRVLEINPPDPICSGEPLDLTELLPLWVQLGIGYWQLSPTDTFNPNNTITYTNQPLDVSYNNWFLRYHFQVLEIYEWYSNVVQITVNSLEGLTLKGNESVNTYQEVEYQVIDSINNYANYSYDWSLSDEQAEIFIIDNGCKVIWKTAGIQEVSVIVTDNTTGCTETFGLDVEVTACIDNIQEIVLKNHTEGKNSYVLILIYPNQDDDQNDENDYKYEWLYSQKENGSYEVLPEGTWNKQYYYGKDKRIEDGWYKVRITKRNCSTPAETKPKQVKNNSQHLRIYPNPSHRGNNLVVVKDCEGTAHLTIYSTDGRLLHTQMVTDNQTTISINLPLGVYVAYLTNSEGYTKVGKLIIQ